VTGAPYRLAHLTDPHFRSLAGVRLVDFTGKRAVGILNVAVNRRRVHKMELLEAMADDLVLQRPDHVVVSGDLSNVSLEAEWREGLRWLERLGRSAEDVTVIPGNHDAYVPDVVKSGVFERLFGAYQSVRPERGERAGRTRNGYPFLRLRGPVAIVAVNSCVATGDLGAWGDIGAEQLAALRAMLDLPEARARRRVVVLHHPPVQLKGGEERNLRDRHVLAEVLREVGADLVIHGHDHRDELARLPGPADRPIPVVGAGSASYAGAADRRARYNIYAFGAQGEPVAVTTRAHDEPTNAFREVRSERLGETARASESNF